jgi:uncharacterized membrane protein
MTAQRANFWILLLFAATTAYAAIVYPGLPDSIPIHWNIRGEVDGWGPKSTIFLGPGLTVFAWILLHGLPKLSPKQFTIDTFGPTFNLMMVIVAALFAYIGCVIIHSAGHPLAPVGQLLVGGIGLFFALLGNLMGKTRRNFYVGIRTPWTLASERVWDATHRLGGRWMAAGGIIAAAMVLLFNWMIPAFVVIMVSCLYPVLFSYLYYKRLEGSGGL